MQYMCTMQSRLLGQIGVGYIHALAVGFFFLVSPFYMNLLITLLMHKICWSHMYYKYKMSKHGHFVSWDEKKFDLWQKFNMQILIMVLWWNISNYSNFFVHPTKDNWNFFCIRCLMLLGWPHMYYSWMEYLTPLIIFNCINMYLWLYSA